MKWSKFNRNYFRPGDWNAIDDVTGFKVKASETSLQWDGMRTKKALPRHPQDFLRALPERIRTPWTRSEGDDTFVN